MSKKILITSALLYANGPIHFGHLAGAYLPADCYARFQRLQGNKVLYISGSDEYGVAITLSADLAKRTPREHVDLYHKINKDYFKRMDISFDNYSRTTIEQHVKPSQQFFLDLVENGYIEAKVTGQLYSEKDKKFLADRYVIGTCPKCGYEKARGDECPKCGASYETTALKDPRSKLTNSSLNLKETKHWFLHLEKFKERLLEWLKEKEKTWKPNVVNFIKGYIKEIHPRAITRDANWGVKIPLPDTDGKVLYVWFDAPVGYISSSMEWAEKEGKPEAWKDFWLDPETKLVHFIGKDNIPFHAAIFPAMVMGQNTPYKLVDELPANEFYNLEGSKFSKSEGWNIDLEDFLSSYTVDQLRYSIMANAPETSDSEFTWKAFQKHCNSDLLGKYGNFINRTFVFAKKHCGGEVPEKVDLEEVDQEFLEKVKVLSSEIQEAYEKFKLRKVCQLMIEIAQQGNIYFDAKHPWKDVKEEGKLYRMRNTIACCLESAKVLALASFPIIPETAAKLWQLLGFDGEVELANWDAVLSEFIPQGQQLLDPVILFKKVEDKQVKDEILKLKKMAEEAKKKQNKKIEPLKEAIDFDAVQKLDLRVGRVLNAEKVPKSKKLLKLEVDLGFETRSILSGIGKSYQPEELLNKKVVVVANLHPKKMMGLESQGMVLAGDTDKGVEVVFVEEGEPGSVVS